MSGSTPEPYCLLSVKVAPRAKSNRLQFASGKLKAWVTAPPTDGQANQAVTKLLAKRLGIAQSRLNLAAGASSREKVFRIDGLTLAEAEGRL